MQNEKKQANSKPLMTFVKTKGTPVAGRYKGKKERIYETICDLQLAIDGLIVQLTRSERFEQLQQSSAAFARACSVFLRKMVIGDRNESKTRLLDDDIFDSLGLKFHRLRKVHTKGRIFDIEFRFLGGHLEIKKLNEETLAVQSVERVSAPPLQMTISVEWPLPGAASWNDTPTREEPWEISSEELFDLHSRGSLNCDQWLGQQLVMFDGKGITLKDVIRTIVNYEGAHSMNVSRLLRTESERETNPIRNPEIHILNNIKICGIKYNHIVVIECALYLYRILLDNKELEKPQGEIDMPTLGLVSEISKDTFSSAGNFLAYDGGVILSFGGTEKKILHRIKAIK